MFAKVYDEFTCHLLTWRGHWATFVEIFKNISLELRQGEEWKDSSAM